MRKWISHESTRIARRVNLHDFLLSCRPYSVTQAGDGLRLRCNNSVLIKKGSACYEDSSDGSTGNPIDCLMFYLDYSFPDAVEALCGFAGVPIDGLDDLP